MAVKWLYDEARHRFLNANTGKPLTQKQMITIRDSFVEARQEMVRGIVEQFSAGTITQTELASSLNAATAETMTALSVIGAGGAERVEQMGPTFRDVLEEQLNRQVPYMNSFMQEVQAGSVSGDEAANRATMYQSAAIQAYEQASAAEAGVADDLPYFPADWDTLCKAGCRCAWEIETVYEGNDEVTYATWQTEEDDAVCEDCQARADAWQHKEIGRTVGAAPMAGVA